jgi:uncharacterized protein (TIGR00369 family)
MAIWRTSFPLEGAMRGKAAQRQSRHRTDRSRRRLSQGAHARRPRTRQPAGVLHGGASVVLAETLASWAAAYVVDPEKYHCVGQEINANHVRAVDSGWVFGIARPIHLGRGSHVWDVRIHDEKDRLVCVSRVTIAVLSTPMRY